MKAQLVFQKATPLTTKLMWRINYVIVDIEMVTLSYKFVYNKSANLRWRCESIKLITYCANSFYSR